MAQLNQAICVIGLGYIGLPTASLLATKGYTVLGVDVSQKVVDTINSGEIHIVEPGLDVLVRSAVNSGNLIASLEPNLADVYILAVPTPFLADHKPDLSYVKAAAQSIAKLIQPSNLIILESTSPVGTTQLVKETIEKINPSAIGAFYVHCPERVIPGRVLKELVENDRVVGGLNQASTQQAVAFYQSFVEGKVIATDARTAELCKLTENSFRDVNIAFANELSLICDKLNINVWELIRLANHHPRVNILQPGPGVGGHCIAVDPWFVVSSCPDEARLIKAARQVNDAKPHWVVKKVVEFVQQLDDPPVIACLGVTFKANIDDLRESPALDIANQLKREKIGEVLVVEPNITHLDNHHLLGLEEALEQANIVLILVDHEPFKYISKKLFEGKLVVDTKGLFSDIKIKEKRCFPSEGALFHD